MKGAVFTIVLLVSVFVESGWAQMKETSRDDQTVGRIIEYQNVVNADVATVWRSISTAEGVQETIAPAASIELKAGGRWRTHMRPGRKIGDQGTIENTIQSFVPNEMLSMQVGVGDFFSPEVRNAQSIFGVITLAPVGTKQTRVTVRAIGFGVGAGWDEAYKVLRECTRDTLVAITERFRGGPFDWVKRNPYAKGHNHAPIQ